MRNDRSQERPPAAAFQNDALACGCRPGRYCSIAADIYEQMQGASRAAKKSNDYREYMRCREALMAHWARQPGVGDHGAGRITKLFASMTR